MAIDLNELATAIGQLILRFRLRRRTAAQWTTVNEVLLSAEMGLESDTNKIKIGDGVSPWSDLAYLVTDTGGGGGGSGPLTPDTPPSTPTPFDDEFEFGTAVDTAGARRSGAHAWVQHAIGGATPPAVDGGLVGAAYNPSGGGSIMLQTAPVGDCTFVAKVKRKSIAINGAFNLGFLNSANGKFVSAQLYTSPTLVAQRGSFDATTWAYTFSSNQYIGSDILDGDQPIYIRIRLLGTTIYFGFNSSGHSSEWVEPYNEDVSTYLGGITDVGMFLLNSTGTCDWFRRTA